MIKIKQRLKLKDLGLKQRVASGFLAILLVASAIIVTLPSPKAAAAVQTKQGSFAVPASTGNFSVTGLGFQPKAVLFWGNGETSDGSGNTNNQDFTLPEMLMGMTDGTNQAVLFNSDDYSSGDPGIYGGVTLYAMATDFSADVVLYQANTVSLDSGGFTLDFTTIDGTHGIGDIVNYMALGGSGVTNAAVTSWTAPTSTGSQTISTVGFQPSAVVLIGGSTADGGTGGLGFASSNSAMGAMSSSYGTTEGSCGQYMREDQAYVETGGPTKRYDASLSSFNSNGFTLNWTTAAASSPSTMYALSLKGPAFQVGSFNQNATTGNQTISSIGFQPEAVLFGSGGNTYSTSVNGPSKLQWMIGGSDGTNSGVMVSDDLSNGNDTLSRSNAYESIDDDGSITVTGAASVSSFSSSSGGSFTLNYGTSDGAARAIFYLAIGASNSSPSAPTLISPTNSATNVSATSTFQLSTTDPDSDYVNYMVQVCSTSNCSSVVNSYCQVSFNSCTGSQTGWSGQNANSSAAYTSGSTATYVYQGAALSPNTQYWWQAYAIDPGGSDVSSSVSSISSFTTTPAITLVQAAENFDSSTGVPGLSTSFSSSVTAGDLIIVSYSGYSSSLSNFSLTDSLGTSYSNAVGRTDSLSGSTYPTAIAWGIAPSSGADTVSMAVSGNTTYARTTVQEYSGINSVDVTASAAGTSSTLDSGFATTNHANELIFGWMVSENGVTSPGSGYTLRETSGSESSMDKIVSSTGSYDVNAPNNSGSSTWSALMATFYLNSGPSSPTLIYPGSSATNVSTLPIFQLSTTDASGDYVQYLMQLFNGSGCTGSQVGSNIDQTSSQTGWQGQNAGSGSAYSTSSSISGSAVARYQYPSALTPNTTYSWQAKAINSGGSNSWSSYSTCQNFTTNTSEVNIKGGTTINGGTTVQ